MSDIAIKVEELSKLYRLGEITTGTISHDLNRWWARMRGKEDPFTKIGETNDRTVKDQSGYAWALKDLNFEVKQGEVLGIIGRNGAGKSTLLKLLSKVTAPSHGRIKVKGRIASLLEVGTGFHPELTGRENIYLNGAILGMTKAEIRSKFDEIVDFAGVERYIDTPVKRYSSGMYVRLAFAVAAFLEPEILIVDEVLAVGDSEFQKKCLGRMKDVSKNDGRTVLFVSHNMTAVRSLCQSAILLSKGTIEINGSADVIVDYYLQTSLKNKLFNELNTNYEWNGSVITVKQAAVIQDSDLLYIDEPLKIEFEIDCSAAQECITFSISICDEEGLTLFAHNSPECNLGNGEHLIACNVPADIFNDNKYSVIFQMVQYGNQIICRIDDILTFEMKEKERVDNYLGKWGGKIRPQIKWNIESL